MTVLQLLPTPSALQRDQASLRVAIIGGGATAITLIDAIELRARQDGLDVEITVYEADPRIGPGRAYQNDGDYGLLNRQACFMSIKRQDPGHFVDWLKVHHGEELASQEFLPRRYFGQYLSECFAQQLGNARQRGRPIQVVAARATSLSVAAEGVLVGTAGGPARSFDRVAVCIGTAEPHDLFGLGCMPRYIGNPYPMWTRFAGIGSHDHVAIIGTSLSAVDAVLALVAQGHQGPISMLSRNGLLPAVRMPHHDFQYRVLSPELLLGKRDATDNIAWLDWLRIVADELRAQGVDIDGLGEELAPVQCARARLVRHLAAAQAGAKWLSVLVDISKDYIEQAWDSLSDADRRAYLGNYHCVFMSLCNPMPPQTAGKLLQLLESGQLSIRGGLETVQPIDERSFRLVHGGGVDQVDWVINATRSETGGIGKVGEALVGAMVGNGVAQLHPFGGIKVEFGSHRVIDRFGQPSNQVFALGQLASGNHYYTSSLPMISRQIERLLPALLAPHYEQVKLA
ncbi:FAD/NAD(P)-binding protein [Pseudomonas mosselii]|uniref:FAD/NAD(P)-binding protein n=1 Tax=Pseudomonas mosselii TaxID=78327 RepID=A0AA42RV97_9PSED|nr:FAD/NAD(P)-binding protein [Pseudomonas mosselii]MDH1630844.1 FAD/NAD(P)-binding protein [Pseudomonas mosselii]